MIVKVKGAGIKLAGKWKFRGQTAEIDKQEYEVNKEYVEVIQEDEKSVSKGKKKNQTPEGE